MNDSFLVGKRRNLSNDSLPRVCVSVCLSVSMFVCLCVFFLGNAFFLIHVLNYSIFFTSWKVHFKTVSTNLFVSSSFSVYG